MREILRWASPIQARLLVGLLEEAGISAGMEIFSSSGPYSSGQQPSASVWITRNEDYEAALGIAKSCEHKPDHCGNCGYDLTGLQNPRCPECGTPFVMPPPRKPWKCAHCGEEVEGQFTDCWKCGSPKPK